MYVAELNYSEADVVMCSSFDRRKEKRAWARESKSVTGRETAPAVVGSESPGEDVKCARFYFPAARLVALPSLVRLTGGPRAGSRAYNRLVLAGSILIGSRQRTTRMNCTRKHAGSYTR